MQVALNHSVTVATEKDGKRGFEQIIARRGEKEGNKVLLEIGLRQQMRLG